MLPYKMVVWEKEAMATLIVVVVFSYFIYYNKQTSAKTWWAFQVIIPS